VDKHVVRREDGAMTAKTVQMTIDETLLMVVDQLVQSLGTNRSAFLRELLEDALHAYHIKRLEEQHAAGYAAIPQTAEEASEWDSVRAWGDA
jgi:metal-responsive CopG/Arc/MetJ family transcriptional regulator